jgi:hypothetical protein
MFASPAAEGKAQAGSHRSREKGRVISVTVEKELLSRSDDLARSLRTDRAGLIERGLKAVLTVAGRE